MVAEFPSKFAPAVLAGQQGFILRNEIKPSPKINEVVSMVAGDHGIVITNKHRLLGIEKVRFIVNQTALTYKLVIFINDRPLSNSETLLFCFLAGFNSSEDFCIHWLQGAKEINLYKHMYRWIELPF